MNDNDKKNIIISGINLVNAGSLAILNECLGYLSRNLSDRYNIIALVHDRSLFELDNLTLYEFPGAQRSWFDMLYYEYSYFRKISRRLKPFLWLSLNGITPSVKAEILAVYCHNSSPFYKLSFRDIITDPKFALSPFMYRCLYMINIRRNDFVIVQQDCLREKFESIFCLNNVIVSHPGVDCDDDLINKTVSKKDKFIFFYPSFPRVFKNFEVICEAVKSLLRMGEDNFEVYFTIDGKENIYSRHVFNKYKELREIKFMGHQSREKIFEYYDISDCMIFPSKLESWGLPITEFKKFGKPILLADLRYARETIGDYDKVKFFSMNDHKQLSDLMSGVMKNELIFEKRCGLKIDPPFAADWQELFDILLSEKRI